MKPLLLVSVFDRGAEGTCYSCSGLKVWDEDLHEPQGLPCYYEIKSTLNSTSTETKQSQLPCKDCTAVTTVQKYRFDEGQICFVKY